MLLPSIKTVCRGLAHSHQNLPLFLRSQAGHFSILNSPALISEHVPQRNPYKHSTLHPDTGASKCDYLNASYIPQLLQGSLESRYVKAGYLQNRTSKLSMSVRGCNDASTYINKTMYPLCSLRNIEFLMIIEEHAFENSEALEAPVDFALANLQQKSSAFETTKTATSTSFFLMT